MKNRYKVIVILGMSAVLSGCGLIKTDSITFIEVNTINLNNDFKISNLIETCDNYNRESFIFDEEDTFIILPNDKKINILTKKDDMEKGKNIFEFEYEDEIYQKVVNIEDTNAPQIICDDKIQIQQNSDFKIEDKIFFKDDLTANENIEYYIIGFCDIKKIGQYNLEVVAYDSSKNKSVKKVIVEVIGVKEEKKDTQPKEKKQVDSTNKNNSNTSNDKKTNNNTSNSKNNKGSYKPDSRTFTIDDYNSFDECLKACETYINTCIAKGFKGTARVKPIKKNGLNYGYQAIFE